MHPRISRFGLLAVIVLASPSPVTGADMPAPATGPALVEDLRATLAWHGTRCPGILDVKVVNDGDLTVTCSDGARYRLQVSKTQEIRVLRMVERIVGSGVSLVLATLRLPSRILGFGASSPEHVADVTKRLFAIVTLAGHDCDEVVSVERRASDDHVVTCSNARVYRVHPGMDGLTVVDG